MFHFMRNRASDSKKKEDKKDGSIKDAISNSLPPPIPERRTSEPKVPPPLPPGPPPNLTLHRPSSLITRSASNASQSDESMKRMEEVRHSFLGRRKHIKDATSPTDQSNPGTKKGILKTKSQYTLAQNTKNSLSPLETRNEKTVPQISSPILKSSTKQLLPLRTKPSGSNNSLNRVSNHSISSISSPTKFAQASLSSTVSSLNSPSTYSIVSNAGLTVDTAFPGEASGWKAKLFEGSNLPLPQLVPPKPPRARQLVINRLPTGDFGFSLRRAIVNERCVDGEQLFKTVLFAEPGSMNKGNDTSLLPGDRLLEVNGSSVEDKDRDEVIQIIKTSGNKVTLSVQPVLELSELSVRSGSNGVNVELDDAYIRMGTLTRSGSKRFKSGYPGAMAKTDEQLAQDKAWLDAQKVWLVHTEGFTSASIVERASGDPDGKLRVRIELTGEVFLVDEEYLEKCNPTQLDRIEDLVQLRHVNESSVMHVLRQRYASNLIHTYAGNNTLIAIRPSYPLSIYTDKIIQLFRGCKSEDMPPHIYATAQTAYRTMLASRSDQAVILLGRSGAGKTTNAKHILHYLSTVAGTVAKTFTVEKWNAASILLEAFASCRTVLNANASRFGHILSVDFDPVGQICNVSIQVLMYERLRTVKRFEGESNFHVFSYLLCGIEDQLLKDLHLDAIDTSCNVVITQSDIVDKAHAQIKWQRLEAAFALLGVSSSESLSIWSVLAAICHLGGAGAVKGGNGRGQFERPDAARRAAYLLGTTIDELSRNAFNSSNTSKNVFRSYVSGDKPGDKSEPMDHLASFIAGMYHEVFSCLIGLIHRAVSSNARPVSSILIIDTPGFQNAASVGRTSGGSFDDLCYNYSQERLQMLFHETTFISPKDRYAQEQINCNLEDFSSDIINSQPVINAIDKQSQQSLVRSSNLDLHNADQRGLLWLLEEEAIFPGATDETFLERLFTHYGNKEYRHVIAKNTQSLGFTMHHSQGTNSISYNVSGWLKSNRDAQSNKAAATLLQDSRNDNISNLFLTCRGSLGGSFGGSVMSLNESGSSSTSVIRRVSSIRRSTVSTIKRKSHCLQIKFQMDGLIETLRRYRLHFVLCVLPQHDSGLRPIEVLSPFGSPTFVSSPPGDDSVLNVRLLRSQLRGVQIPDAVRTFKLGYPEYLQFADFCRRFEMLTPLTRLDLSPSDQKAVVEQMLGYLDLSQTQYQLGASMIFMRGGVLSQLEEQRDDKIQGTIVLLQAACRGYMERRYLNKRKVQDLAIRCVQRNVKKFITVRDWPWWRLLIRIKPLLNVHRTEEELKAKDDELKSLRDKVDKLEKERLQLKHDNDRVEAKLSEITADLVEENATSCHAAEMLEAETAERLRLEKELHINQEKYTRLHQVHEKTEMEVMEMRICKAEMNGDLSDDDQGNNSFMRQKYERAVRELDFTKKRMQQQKEEEEDQQQQAKKQMDRRYTELQEEVEENKQQASQWKRKYQRLQAELNDMKLMYDEQTTRNNVLEKKQRKFDSELLALQEEFRIERGARERLQRERDQLAGEKYALNQELESVKLDLQLREEKVNSLNRELEEVINTAGTKGDSDMVQLKRAKLDLESKLKMQEEELDDLAGQVQMLEQSKLRLEMSFEQTRREHRQEVSQKDEEIEEVRANAHKKVKALEMQLETEHEERSNLIRNKHELERRLLEMQERPGVVPESEEIIQRLKRDLKRTKALLKDAQLMLEHSKDESQSKSLIRQLRNQLEDCEFARMAAAKARQNSDLELHEAQIQLEEMVRLRAETDQRAGALTREKSELLCQIEENEEQTAEVMKKYKAAVSQMSLDQMQLADNAAIMSELEMERNILREQLNELSGKLEMLEGENFNPQTQKRMELRVKELEAKLELETTSRSRFEMQVGRVRDQYDKLCRECDTIRAQEQQAQDVARRLQREMRELKEDQTEFIKKEEELGHRKKEVDLVIENLESENNNLKAELKLASKRIEDLQSAMEAGGSDSETGADSDSNDSLDVFLRRQRRRTVSTGSSPSLGGGRYGNAMGNTLDQASSLASLRLGVSRHLKPQTAALPPQPLPRTLRRTLSERGTAANYSHLLSSPPLTPSVSNSRVSGGLHRSNSLRLSTSSSRLAPPSAYVSPYSLQTSQSTMFGDLGLRNSSSFTRLNLGVGAESKLEAICSKYNLTSDGDDSFHADLINSIRGKMAALNDELKSMDVTEEADRDIREKYSKYLKVKTDVVSSEESREYINSKTDSEDTDCVAGATCASSDDTIH